MFSSLFSIVVDDVVLILKYQFFDENPTKKVCLETKYQNVMEYSKLKLPAAKFIDYLKTECNNFLADCLK